MAITTETVTSADGTPIRYGRLGQGPGLVLVHGGMEHAASHLHLAEALASDFAVYTYDRRGRGLSGSYGEGYSVAKDVDDLDALLSVTGTEQIFGISSGALIGLEAALTLPRVRKLVAYEPPLIVDVSYDYGYMKRYESRLTGGDLAGAMVTGMKGAEMGPPIMNRMPDWLLKPMVRLAMSREDKMAGPQDFTMRRAAPTLSRDFQLVREAAGTLERYRAVRASVLLLGGGRSPRYLKDALDALEAVVPHARRIELAKLGHGGSGNTDRGGDPQTVARRIREFLRGPAVA